MNPSLEARGTTSTSVPQNFVAQAFWEAFGVLEHGPEVVDGKLRTDMANMTLGCGEVVQHGVTLRPDGVFETCVDPERRFVFVPASAHMRHLRGDAR